VRWITCLHGAADSGLNRACTEVKGFSGAKYQSFPALPEAQAFLRDNGAAAATAPPASSSSVITVPVKRKAAAAPAATKTKAAESSASSSRPSSSTHASSSGARVINVYTDGASAGNGKASAKAGWGVWFEDPELQHLNRAGRLAGETQTNNRAELTVSCVQARRREVC
jgi:ribonuclease HI